MTDPSRIRVGVVGGTRLPGNVRTLLRNVRNLLESHPVTFEMDLVINDSVNLPQGFTPVDPGFADTDRALGTLKTLTSGLIEYGKAHEVDILFQVTKFPVHGFATAVAGKVTDTPVLTRLAGDNFREYRVSSERLQAVKAFGLNNIMGRVPLYWSDRIIVLGPHGRSEIARRNGDIPISEIPQPIDFEQFRRIPQEIEQEIRNKLGFPSRERVLLTVGRLTERKGMGTLIETAENLSERGQLFHWYVIGKGPMREELGNTNGVETLGRIPFEQITDYYHASDIVVHPSFIEGLPNVLLEASACGTPTLAREVGDSAMVASATFSDDEELLDLLRKEHEPAELPEGFDPNRLEEAYAEAILRTIRDH
ncbi:MAG: glycosyltransferase family 4 protein [Halodesulfurarchaeum sp.]|nr:glycosyltransferase family 4 protein [Halodesulfurarchaeum sp.]